MNYIKIYKHIIKNAKYQKRIKTTPKNNNYIYYENHHIIPKCLCKNKQWKNFKTNLVLLTVKEHYICHILLTKIFPHNKNLLYACWWMSKSKDINFLNYLKKQYSLIQSERASKLFKGKKKSREQTLKAIKTRLKKHKEEISQRMKGKNNIVYKEGVVNKIINTKSNTIINGKNMFTISAERAAKTMKNVYITDTGEETTIYKESSKKHSKTLNQIVYFNNTEMTLKQKYGIERSIERTKQGKKYILKNIFDGSFEKIMYQNEIMKISPALYKLRKENYLGKSKYGKTTLTKKGKEHLIGLYTIPL